MLAYLANMLVTRLLAAQPQCYACILNIIMNKLLIIGRRKNTTYHVTILRIWPTDEVISLECVLIVSITQELRQDFKSRQDFFNLKEWQNTLFLPSFPSCCTQLKFSINLPLMSDNWLNFYNKACRIFSGSK